MWPGELKKNQRSLPYDKRLFLNRRGCLSIAREMAISKIGETVISKYGTPTKYTYKVALHLANVCFFGVPMGKLLTVFCTYQHLPTSRDQIHFTTYKITGICSVLGALHPVARPYWKNIHKKRLAMSDPAIGW